MPHLNFMHSWSRKILLSIAFNLSILIVLGACMTTSTQGQIPVDYKALKFEELKDQSTKTPAKFLFACSVILGTWQDSDPSPLIDKDKLVELLNGVLDKLATDFVPARQSKSWNDAFRILETIHAVAQDDILKSYLGADTQKLAQDYQKIWTELTFGRAEEYVLLGLSCPALVTVSQYISEQKPDKDALSDEALGTWIQRAFIAKDRASLATMTALGSTRGLEIASDVADFLKSVPGIESQRAGLVTIRVDKGIKIENGFGITNIILGTGFYIDKSGYVITNYHVIESEVDPKYKGYSKVSIVPPNARGARQAAKVVGYDKLLDLALLKTEPGPGYVFSVSNGDGLKQGQKVLAFGSPAGLENSVTSGIISSLERRFLQVGDIFQIDAALNPGNSGGPILDENGDVIGVGFAGLSDFQGLNFGIPGKWLLKVIPRLFDGGEVKRAWLGLALHDPESGTTTPEGGLSIIYRAPSISHVLEDGDTLTSIDGNAYQGIPAAQAIVDRMQPESMIAIKIKSEKGVTISRACYAGSRPFSPLEDALDHDKMDSLLPVLYGMSAMSLPGKLFDANPYVISYVWPGSAADDAGISENDPFSLRSFSVNKDDRVALLVIEIKKRKDGYLPSVMQIPASLELTNIL